MRILFLFFFARFRPIDDKEVFSNTTGASFLSQDDDTKLSTLFMDSDSLASNNVQFEILNDTMGIFQIKDLVFVDDTTGKSATIYHNSEWFDLYNTKYHF